MNNSRSEDYHRLNFNICSMALRECKIYKDLVEEEGKEEGEGKKKIKRK